MLSILEGPLRGLPNGWPTESLDVVTWVQGHCVGP